ncbi:Peroxidase, family 2-domain-containing protein [Massariosphaeria phaeospora]|uniref:Peroxidase, family 2-domain-containing protein n=1 Tax=Massariosphaeria phaeospora TaxID=100035 RepID=A0A7C8HYE9_9PLEO|nr:Peroxidase, family 2-domain-containing protein [Massariosphaeria phaeospora]
MRFISTLVLAAMWKQASALPHTNSNVLNTSDRIIPPNSTLKPQHFTWLTPSADDDRAPCPMLNTLANHGFLPHNGRAITRDIFLKGVTDALNFDRESVDRLFGGALGAVPEFNATSFDLGMLHVKNFIEHDGSTSMQDVILDQQSSVYHEPTFSNFMSYIPHDANTISIPAAAAAKARHFKDMSKINPRFSILASQQTPVMLEMASMFLVFGPAATTKEKGADRAFFEYFFRNQRLPVELGWTPPQTEILFTNASREIAAQLVKEIPTDVPFLYNPGEGLTERAGTEA